MVCLPATLPLVALADAALRTRWAFSRALAFMLGTLGAEALGLLASFGLWLFAGPWLGARESFLRRSFQLQLWWVSALLALARRIYGLRFEVDLAKPCERALLVLVRHASLVDSLLPTVFVSGRDGTRLRFVLKRELLLDPCLDVVGQRLPNVFLARGADESAREEESIRRLAADLGPHEGVVITHFGPVLLGGLIGRRIRVWSWCLPVSALPAERGARLARLDAEWARIDDWIEACEREALG